LRDPEGGVLEPAAYLFEPGVCAQGDLIHLREVVHEISGGATAAGISAISFGGRFRGSRRVGGAIRGAVIAAAGCGEQKE